MRITLTSVPVADQARALTFYTDILRFVTKHDIPLGAARWLTVVSPDQPDGPELLLEPMDFVPVQTYQQALFDAGIPWTAFEVADIQQEYQRLAAAGVVFKAPPAVMGPVIVATFEDTCGNLIQMMQKG